MIPPQLARFRALTGVGDAPLETAFRLRHALALLDDERDPFVGTIDEHLAAIS